MGKGEQKRGHAYPDNIHFYDEMYFNHSSPEFVPKAKDMLTNFHAVFDSIDHNSDNTFFLSLVSIFLMILTRELRYSDALATSYSLASALGQDVSHMLDRTANSSTITILWMCFVLRFLQTAVSILTCVNLFMLYRQQFKYTQLTRQYYSDFVLWPDHVLKPFLFECFICMLHEFPIFDYALDISLPVAEQALVINGVSGTQGPIYILNPHALFVFLRLYIIVRFVHLRFYPRGAKILAEWYRFDLSIPFAIRHIINTTPVNLVLFILGMFLTTLSYSAWVCEREIWNVPSTLSIPQSYFANLYIVASTITTIGYGDITARTVCGRSIFIIVGVMGQLVVALASTSLMFWVPLAPWELNMNAFLDNSAQRDHKYGLAAVVIQRFWRCYAARNSSNAIKKASLHRHMISALLDFHIARIDLISADARQANLLIMVNVARQINTNNRLVRNVFLRKIEADRVAEIKRVEDLRKAKIRHAQRVAARIKAQEEREARLRQVFQEAYERIFVLPDDAPLYLNPQFATAKAEHELLPGESALPEFEPPPPRKTSAAIAAEDAIQRAIAMTTGNGGKAPNSSIMLPTIASPSIDASTSRFSKAKTLSEAAMMTIETQNTTAKDEAIKALENVELIRRKNEESRKELERREKERQLAEQQESDLYLLNLKQWAMTPKTAVEGDVLRENLPVHVRRTASMQVMSATAVSSLSPRSGSSSPPLIMTNRSFYSDDSRPSSSYTNINPLPLGDQLGQPIVPSSPARSASPQSHLSTSRSHIDPLAARAGSPSTSTAPSMSPSLSRSNSRPSLSRQTTMTSKVSLAEIEAAAKAAREEELRKAGLAVVEFKGKIRDLYDVRKSSHQRRSFHRKRLPKITVPESVTEIIGPFPLTKMPKPPKLPDIRTSESILHPSFFESMSRLNSELGDAITKLKTVHEKFDDFDSRLIVTYNKVRDKTTLL